MHSGGLDEVIENLRLLRLREARSLLPEQQQTPLRTRYRHRRIASRKTTNTLT
jgi:hypothetical protein